ARFAAAPPVGDFAEQVAQRPEGVAEGAPVVEVDGAAELLGEAGDALALGTVAGALVPGLEAVEPGGEEPGDGGGDQQVVEVALGLVDDPGPLLVVDHAARALGEHA